MNARIFLFTLLFLSTANVGLSQNIGLATSTNRQGETTITVSPLDPRILVAGWMTYASPDDWPPTLGVAYTIDGGQSWMSGLAPTEPNTTRHVDPSLAAGGDGSFYYGFMHSMLHRAPMMEFSYRNLRIMAPVGVHLSLPNSKT